MPIQAIKDVNVLYELERLRKRVAELERSQSLDRRNATSLRDLPTDGSARYVSSVVVPAKIQNGVRFWWKPDSATGGEQLWVKMLHPTRGVEWVHLLDTRRLA